MSYCPKCNENVEVEQKTKISKTIAKGAVNAAGATVNVAMKVHDQSVYESEKNKMFKFEAKHNRAVRNAQSNAATQVMNNLNNKTLDLAMGNDHYFACSHCSMEIKHPQCETRPEYLGASYDASTNTTKKIFAALCLFITYSIFSKSSMGSNTAAAWSAIGAAIAGYFSLNFIPLKARGVVNLIGENIKAVIGVGIVSSITLLIFMIAIESYTSTGMVREVASISLLVGIGGVSIYSLFLLNKEKWAEIKETWALLDQLEDESQTDDDHNQAA